MIANSLAILFLVAGALAAPTSNRSSKLSVRGGADVPVDRDGTPVTEEGKRPKSPMTFLWFPPGGTTRDAVSLPHCAPDNARAECGIEDEQACNKFCSEINWEFVQLDGGLNMYKVLNGELKTVNKCLTAPPGEELTNGAQLTLADCATADSWSELVSGKSWWTATPGVDIPGWSRNPIELVRNGQPTGFCMDKKDGAPDAHYQIWQCVAQEVNINQLFYVESYSTEAYDEEDEE